MRPTSGFSAIFAIILFFATHAFAQEHPAITAQANTLYVGADGNYEAAPDTALIQFGLSVQEGKAQAAYRKGAVKPLPLGLGIAGDIRRILRSKTDFVCIR